MSGQEKYLQRIDELEEIIERQKGLEKSLRESEEVYRTISQKSFAFIYVVQDGVFRKVNANAAAAAGYTIEEMTARKADSLVHPDDKRDVLENSRNMLRGHSSEPYFFRIITKQGEIRWVMETVSRITYGGRPAILGNSMDITAQRDAVVRLQESENLYRAIFETTGTATIIIEADTTVSLVNSQFTALHGSSREEWEGKKSWLQFVIPEDQNKMKSYHFLRRIDRNAAPRNYEFGFIDSQGTVRDVILTVDMIPGTKKSVASFADITDRKLAATRLRESENLYRAIFETTGTATIIIEEDTTISLVNSEFVNLSGYTREEWEGKKSWTEFVDLADRERMKTYHYLRRIDHRAAPRNYECGFINSKGEVRNVILTVDIIPGTKKSVASFADITEHKLSQAKLKESENLYRTIFENTGTATIIVEEDMTISLANTEFESLSGASKGYWEDKRKWTELFSEKDLREMRRYHRQRRIDPASTPRNYQCTLTDKHGNRKVIFLAVAMIPGSTKSVLSLTDITEQKRIEAALRKQEQEVKQKSRNLEDVNTALKVLLKQREDDKQELEEKVLSNVKDLVMPYIEKLKASRLNPQEGSFVKILESNLNNIVSPFSQRLSSKYLSLTPKEIQVANLIRDGKTTKEIADIMTVCMGAVSLHRDHIRKKLGLNNKKINLKSYLDSLS
ncbi:MAG: PAS domain S-box protein [Syntrophales bacterium]|nr:PAS domain S-box protein [Syntrophales bacterium]